MEVPFGMHPNPAPGPVPFFYYNPDPNASHGQHGYFSTHPSEAQVVNHHAPVYPHHQCAQQHQHQHQQQQQQQPQTQQPLPQHAFEHANDAVRAVSRFTPSPMATFSPTASPQPLHIKPSILLQQESHFLTVDTSCMGTDAHSFPATPPLSTSGSTISSPPSSCGVLHTPVNGGYFRLESIEGVKEGCEGDVVSELLANCDWARSNSPPLTPGKSNHHIKRL